MNRRKFINKAALLSAATLFVGQKNIQAKPSAKLKKLPGYGIIITAQVDWFREDPRKALKTLSEEGYSEIEFSGELGIPDDEAKKLFKELNINPLIGGGAMYQLAADPAAFKAAMED